MSLSEFEVRRIERAANSFLAGRRPPAEIRDKGDLDYRIDNQSVIIFEIHPVWNDPSKNVEHVIAKATFVKTEMEWRVYWQRADLKWHSYPPSPEVKTIEDFFEIVDKDECGCFFG